MANRGVRTIDEATTSVGLSSDNDCLVQEEEGVGCEPM